MANRDSYICELLSVVAPEQRLDIIRLLVHGAMSADEIERRLGHGDLGEHFDALQRRGLIETDDAGDLVITDAVSISRTSKHIVLRIDLPNGDSVGLSLNPHGSDPDEADRPRPTRPRRTRPRAPVSL